MGDVALLPEASVEDQVLRGFTWEEIAGIPDESLRRRAVELKQYSSAPVAPVGPSIPSREPDPSQALLVS